MTSERATAPIGWTTSTAGTPETATGRLRLIGLDRLRGLAIVAMMTSHAMATFPTTIGTLTRLTVLRFVAPIFVVIAGALLASRAPSSKAVLRLSIGFALTVLVTLPLGPPPLILLQFLVCLALWPLCLRVPSAVAFVCVSLAMNSTVLSWPAGLYDPAAMLLAMLLGRFVGRERLSAIGSVLPRSLGFVGRWPLSFYVGHLLALALLVLAGIGRPWT